MIVKQTTSNTMFVYEGTPCGKVTKYSFKIPGCLACQLCVLYTKNCYTIISKYLKDHIHFSRSRLSKKYLTFAYLCSDKSCKFLQVTYLKWKKKKVKNISKYFGNTKEYKYLYFYRRLEKVAWAVCYVYLSIGSRNIRKNIEFNLNPHRLMTCIF